MAHKLKADATNITVKISRELAKRMGKYPEVTWSIVARIAFINYCNERELKKPVKTDMALIQDIDTEKEPSNKQETIIESSESNG